MSTPVCLLYATFPDTASAAQTARALVAEHLAACCNLIGPIHAVYWWEGQVREDEEQAMLIKTTTAMAAQAITRIVALHPYENPAVIQLPISAGAADFLRWIAMSVLPEASDS